jgi:hypothetical protein
MVQYADGLVAIGDGHSRGTSNMIEQAKEHFLRCMSSVWTSPKTDDGIPGRKAYVLQSTFPPLVTRETSNFRRRTNVPVRMKELL